LRTTFGVNSDKTLVDLLTFKCKEQIFFGVMELIESLGKTTYPFSQKCI
jgi:hypothetical protein